jgi:BirA family transcriptional regulator, biotin operon repressor / biotin---[acetyl-CoA-carboxylase] ligase
MFESKLLQNNLPTEVFGKKIFSFDKIDSTNNLAKILAELGHDEGTVVISDVQTQGRGRHGKEWISEPAKNLLFSTIIRPKLETGKIQLITFFLANTIASVIERKFNCIISLKWPNDMLINNKKFGGILVESNIQNNDSFIIAGIGININQEEFPPEIPDATSLFLETKSIINIEELFSDILIGIDKEYKEFLANPDSSIEQWKTRNMLDGKEINILQRSQIITGKYHGIDKSGALLLQTQDRKILNFFSGEVSLAKIKAI